MYLTKEAKDVGSDVDDEEKQLESSLPVMGEENIVEPVPSAVSREQKLPEPDPSDPFEVKWDENDPLNPRTALSKGRKWLITLIIGIASVCVTDASALYTSTYGQLTQEFQVSREAATLGLSLFVLGLGILA